MTKFLKYSGILIVILYVIFLAVPFLLLTQVILSKRLSLILISD